MTLILALRQQRQVDLHEFEAILVYITILSQPGLYCESLSQKGEDSGDRTQALQLARQVLYQLSCLSRPVTFYKGQATLDFSIRGDQLGSPVVNTP